MRAPDEAARAWYLKARDEEDQFDRFVYLWFSFNILYSEYMTNDERWAIRKFVQSRVHSIRNVEQILNHDDSRYFVRRIIRNCRIDDTQDTSELAAKLKNPRNLKTVRFEALMLILYQVRCNLFHGNKLFSSESDQEVVMHAANVLESILGNWIVESNSFRRA